MTIRTKIHIIATLLVIVTSALPVSVSASASAFLISEPYILPLSVEADGSTGEQPKVLREISFGDRFKFPIVQQPRGDMVFVSPISNYVTEYQAAAEFDTIGLLAHNYLAGQYFFKIVPGQEITLHYKDSGTKEFVVTEILQYQALSPESPSSDFIDQETGERLTATQLFFRTYGGKSGRLILQTCITASENPSWGRLFVIATPKSK